MSAQGKARHLKVGSVSGFVDTTRSLKILNPNRKEFQMYDREIHHYEVTVWELHPVIVSTWHELFTKTFHNEDEAISFARSQDNGNRQVRVREVSNIIGWWD